MKPFGIFVAIFFLVLNSYGQTNKQIFQISSTPWKESLGNHRAVLEVKNAAEAIRVKIDWRRHDINPGERRFLIIEAKTGDTISNIRRLLVSNEKCDLVFGPVKRPGIYFFYYLPYEIQENYGFYNKDYFEPEAPPSKHWVEKNDLNRTNQTNNLPLADLLEIQSRTAFDNFFPMEVIATTDEKEALKQKFDQDFLLFPESRENPIRMLDEIPEKWIQSGPSNHFTGKAKKNEYYTFQLGLYAAQKDIEQLNVSFSDLENGSNKISGSLLTCFNTGGVDPYGNTFEKKVDVAMGHVQPLWIGVDIIEDIVPGTYKGSLVVGANNAVAQTIEINLLIENETLADRGDGEPWRHSRLRWLNSTLGIDDKPTGNYQTIITVNDRTYELSGKKIKLNGQMMPVSLDVYGTELLERPVSFVVETSEGELHFLDTEPLQTVMKKSGLINVSWESHSENLSIAAKSLLEADGYMNYKFELQVLNDVQITDIRLEIPLKNNAAPYMMGMGLPGTATPKRHEAKWKGPQDSFWIGSENGGIWCELRGSTYHGPLLNLYKPEYPPSWFNKNIGGFRVEKNQAATKAIVYSGKRDLKKGERIEFEWSFLLTPVKEINYGGQFTDRYYHNFMDPVPSDEDLAKGIKVINLHHANEYNPFINYPFIALDEMKGFVDDMHAKGQKVKIYYTIRELTNYTTELWALRSLGNEIFGKGNGGGYPWLREHLVNGYHPQWYQYFPDKSADASILNAPGASRWYNYYIEGLAWLVRNVDIDGLYLDDVTYDRRTIKRIRKVLDYEKPGCLIDLHSNTGFSKGPVIQYTEFFPFIDKLWFGESFKYDEMPPENWLVEVSGIPFGLMGDMLHRGGNRWLGMLFGMTVRHPWLTDGITCDPRPVWKLWDEFGIHDAQMHGFWKTKPVVTTNNSQVKATAYLKENKMLISIGNFSDEKQAIKLSIDWFATGIQPTEARLFVPEIKDFQPAVELSIEELIPIEPRKGWLIIVERQP